MEAEGMRWDIRNSWLVAIASILSAAIATGEVVGRVWGSNGFMNSLRTPIPLWVLIATVLLLPPLNFLAAKHAIRSKDTDQQESPESTLVLFKEWAKDSQSARAEIQAKLDEYESLEREIVGHLVPGEELSTDDLLTRLSISKRADRRRILDLAVASLEQKGKIVGTGPILRGLKLTSKSSS
jgi:hypothetical protein